MVTIGSLFLLAAEASAAHSEVAEGGFGLNFDFLETNLVNLGLLIGILVYFGRPLLSNILSERRSNIEAQIQEAEQRAKEAAAELAEAQEKLTQAQAEAQNILKNAQTSAQAAKQSILARAEQDVQKLKETAAADLNSEREKAIAQLRASVVASALQKVESELRTGVADDAQQTLIDRSIALIGG